MRIVLGFIAFFTLLIVTAMVNAIYNPTPIVSLSPSQVEDAKRREEEQRKNRIYLQAYDDCRERKVSVDAISRCILSKTN